MADVLTAGHSAKREVRSQISAARARLDPSRQAMFDAARTSRLLNRIDQHGFATVACYASCESEPGTLDLLVELAARSIPVLLPRFTALDTPGWAWWQGEPLVASTTGIAQPDAVALPGSVLAEAEVIIVAGLAGTKAGARLGRGGGWYDRALTSAGPGIARWLLLNDAEVVDELPTDEWDQPMTAIVTERRWIDCV
ncbi:MAG: 5-formyltetrahydrofolate cyclo-ligase [Propionibacteriaceae bacterium]|jgi:5-formyltetrahydrofolate cyclo-ligase|nr:5-formyltetrahydrofolate cyclo-ligase [Propionibacteriaceae bacterium]